MVCHRWTLALILICVTILATVISAFRVRLPGSSHEVKSDLRKHKCDDCDVNDPFTHSFKKDSVKRSYEDLKKVYRDKRQSIEVESTKSSEIKEDSEDDENDDDVNNVIEKATQRQEIVKSKSNLNIKIKSKKASVVLDFNDDEDSDEEDDDDDDDDDEDDNKIKESKKKLSSIIDSKKNIPKSLKPTSSEVKSKTIKDVSVKKKIKTVEEIDEEDKDDDSDEGKDEIIHTKPLIKPPKIPLKSKVDIPVKEATKEDIKSKELPLKPTKMVLKPDETTEKAKPTTKVTDKQKDKSEAQKHFDEHPVKPLTIKASVKESTEDKQKTKGKIFEEDKDIKKIVKEVKQEIKDDDKVIKTKPHEQIKKREVDSKEKISDSPKKERPKKSKEDIVKDSEETEQEYKKPNKTKSDVKDSGIQHLSDVLHRRNLLQSEFEDFYAFFPTFAPNFSRIHNPECRRHGKILLRQLRGTKIWALNLLDATAKIPSGLLQGNGIQLGDFDQCLGVRARVQLDTGSIVKIQGKYCLATIDVKAESPELEMPVYLAQGKNLFKSRIDDPGHFVPRFSTLSWGVCMPSPCNADDVEVILRDAVKHYQYKSGISLRVKVDERNCYTKKSGNWWKDWLEIPTVATLVFYSIVLTLVMLATAQDFLSKKSDNESGEEEDKAEDEQKVDEESNQKKDSGGFLSSFSLYNTLGKLVAPASKGEIACIHGFRAIATVALLLAHKFLPIALTPYTNRLRISEILTSPLLSWCRAGWMFTDCFLLLSGALTSYRKSSSDTVASKMLSRYIRLTPALLAVVLFYAYIWDNISVGPMWGTLVTKNVELCQESWWWNLLYVQNYLGFDDMCAPQTHHMALDFQLTMFGGILVWAIQSEVPFARTVMPLLHLLSAYSRYTTFRDHRLTVLAYQGVSVSQLYRTGSLSYTSIFHRCSPYLIGLSLGLVLRNESQLPKLLKIIGWFVCGTLWGLVLWAGSDAGYLNYRYDVTFAAQYATLAPIATALAFAWMIYAAHNDHSEILSGLLCSRPLLFISRISYALYLIQFIVYLTNTATIRVAKEFSLISLIDIQEFSTILFSSILLTLTLVIPLQSLPKISFTSKPEEVEEENDETAESTSNSVNANAQNKSEAEETEEDDVKQEPVPQPRRSFLAHREVLEEIPEVEVEYEIQRESTDGLEEIIEEEDDGLEEEDEEESQDRLDDEDLEIIEEEQGGEEDFWAERQEYLPRPYSRNDERNLDEWEWTADSNENGGQYYRYSR